MIVADGYNRGRDYIVDQVTQVTHWKGMWWKGEVEWREGLLERGSRGLYLNCKLRSADGHADALISGVNHDIEQDGLVAVLTINRL